MVEMSKVWRAAGAGIALALGLAACSPAAPELTAPTQDVRQVEEDLVRVGFVAVGPEGAWREANEQDIISTFSEEAGFDLSYAPATNLSHQSQVDAFHIFLDDEDVDIILLSPVQSEAWDQPLVRAQIAGVPVILLDRGIDTNDDSLYVTRIAPDNAAVAGAAAEWAVANFPDGATYYTLEGPKGASVVAERNAGWDAVLAQHPEFVEYGSQSADWSFDKATAIFAEALAQSGDGIDFVFAHNDEMGMGAAQAIEAAGLTPGEDVKILTIDGTFAALEALSRGRLSFVGEYNPLFGETALEVVRNVLAGAAVEHEIVVPSATFGTPQEAYDALPSRLY
jgi:ABC-type sugar transport system substrate-binding protein